MTRRVVIVGASLAGATTATTLRELGFDGTIEVVGAEPQLPYERPALSKAFLAGEGSGDDLLVNSAAEYDGFSIGMRLGSAAVGLDTDRRAVSLDDSSTLEYDDLVIATGSVNRRPPIAGMDLSGVHQLRTLADAHALRRHAAAAGSAVIVGQGFIGCEVAATLRSRGLAVTMVDPQPGPLYGPLGSEVSSHVADWHSENGVRLLNEVGVAELTGSAAVDGVRLADGTALEADLVVVGVGARPASDWLMSSGLRMERGAVLVDASGRSSTEAVYAAGDVSAWWDEDLGAHRRVEHYDSALVQGQRVAHTIVGSIPEPRSRSWFWSDQYDHTLQYSGAQQPDDELRWRGATGFWLRQDAVTAVVSLDDGRTFRRAMALIGTRPAMDVLLDDSIDLRSLRPKEQREAAPA
jgi:3-phenylpropionate/trans-cinnamate dioxygenase ferredoxin reductase subunit